MNEMWIFCCNNFNNSSSIYTDATLPVTHLLNSSLTVLLTKGVSNHWRFTVKFSQNVTRISNWLLVVVIRYHNLAHHLSTLLSLKILCIINWPYTYCSWYGLRRVRSLIIPRIFLCCRHSFSQSDHIFVVNSPSKPLSRK